MISMTKRLEFDAGHRLSNHEGKCTNIHGHRYVIDVTITLADEAGLDRAGRIIDFGVVKQKLGTWLDEAFDHGFIVNEADAPTRAFLDAQGHKRYVVPFEPSAENLAAFILDIAATLLDVADVCRVTSIRLFETPTSSAGATR